MNNVNQSPAGQFLTPVKTQLTVFQKKAIIASFKQMEVSYADLAVANNVKKSTVRSFASRFNCTKILRERGGRPCRLDESSIRAVQECLAGNHSMDKYALYDLIREKATQQWLQDRGYGCVRDVPKALLKQMKVSRRCVSTYAKTICPGAFEI